MIRLELCCLLWVSRTPEGGFELDTDLTALERTDPLFNILPGNGVGYVSVVVQPNPRLRCYGKLLGASEGIICRREPTSADSSENLEVARRLSLEKQQHPSPLSNRIVVLFGAKVRVMLRYLPRGPRSVWTKFAFLLPGTVSLSNLHTRITTRTCSNLAGDIPCPHSSHLTVCVPVVYRKRCGDGFGVIGSG